VLLLGLVLAIVALSSLLGPVAVSWHEITHPAEGATFWRLRVPRTLLAAVAGASLALGGVIFQALFRNPLATPYTLGIASGASLATAIGLIAGVSGSILGVPMPTVLAFAGSLGAIGLVTLMAHAGGGRHMMRLLLGGVCVAYLCSAGVMLAQFLASPTVNLEIVMWMMGTLGRFRPAAVVEIVVVLLPVLAYAIAMHRPFDLLSMGEGLAASRGVAVQPLIWTSFVLTGFLVAVVVAACGPIGFVGLMVPHMVRVWVGPRMLPLAIGACLAGAAFLAVCDAIARTVMFELPVGVVTNILGAAFFFYLLLTRDVGGRAAR
jgi:iron complex transport system permease protein